MSAATRCLALCTLFISANSSYAATFTFNFIDSAGVGANDTTPFTPVGGNNAMTLGDARQNVFIAAGQVWGGLLTSNVPIAVDVSFTTQTCSATMGTLANTHAIYVYRNFPNAPSPNIEYVSALADALTGQSLNNLNTTANGAADIVVAVNLAVDSDPTCLGGREFYYGLDHNSVASQQPDLLRVLLHEFTHGLGFSSGVNLATGGGIVSQSDGVERFTSYDYQIFDEQVNLTWPSMTTDAQRMQSATRNGMLGWNGTNVNAWNHHFTAGVTANNRLSIYAPATLDEGSSISHWDTAVRQLVLMQPIINPGITTDVTPCALKDIGWTVTGCPDGLANTAPVAQTQTITTMENTPVTINLTGTDADGDALTYAIATSPTQGTLSVISPTSNAVTYTPTANTSGTDNFTFTVNDGIATSSPATIDLTISPHVTTQVISSHSGGGAIEYFWILLGTIFAYLRLNKRRQSAVC